VANPLKGLLRTDPPKELVLGPYAFFESADPAHCDDTFRHRYAVYAAEGHIDAGAYPGGEFRDAFDSVAVQILAREVSGQAVGSTRIVLPSPLGLPTEHLFCLEPLRIDASRVGEVGRLAIDRNHRGGQRIVMVGLIAQLYNGLRARGLTHFLAFMHPELVRVLNAIRIPIRPVSQREPGPQQLKARQAMPGYFQREALPTLCSLAEMAECIDG
jgi:N-acyl-L-homoserine lactone synthetase